MKIAAVGDVHGSLYLDDFIRSLEKIGEVDLFLLAGDIARRNTLSEFQKVVSLIKSPMVAVFGNEEWENEKYISACPEITFLREQELKFDGIKIVGSTGVLDKPTDWQAENVKDIQEIFTGRLKKINSLLAKDSILLTHYAPTYLTLLGENPPAFPHLGSQKLEKILLDKKPKLAIHAHAHAGTSFSNLNEIPVYNVSMPLNMRITVLEV